MEAIKHLSHSGRRVRSAAAVIGMLALLLVVPLAGTALAAEDGTDDVVLSGQVNVPAGDEVGDIVVFHGSATVAGTVRGSLVVFDGPATISGRVTENVVVINGPTTLANGARVDGDVISPRRPSIDPGAQVGGAVRRLNTDWGFDSDLVLVGGFVAWLSVSLSMLLLGVLLLWASPAAADAAARTARTRPGTAIGWGLAIGIGLPLAALLAIVTVVGIPFGVGVLLAMALLYAIGYVTAAWLLGRAIMRSPGSRLVAFLVGLVVLRLVALVPVLDGLVWFVGPVFGLGVLVAAAARARTPMPATGVPAPAGV